MIDRAAPAIAPASSAKPLLVDNGGDGFTTALKDAASARPMRQDTAPDGKDVPQHSSEKRARRPITVRPQRFSDTPDQSGARSARKELDKDKPATTTEPASPEPTPLAPATAAVLPTSPATAVISDMYNASTPLGTAPTPPSLPLPAAVGAGPVQIVLVGATSSALPAPGRIIDASLPTSDLLAARAPAPPPAIGLADIAPPSPITGATLAAAVAGLAEPKSLKSHPIKVAGPDPLTTTPISATALVTTAAVPMIGREPLDMARQSWPQRLIGHIEELRDAANAVDASIRLAPPSLGKLDVTFRHDPAGTVVHFRAEQQATRQLLHDAQPRLSELAQERGLRLAGSSVDVGSLGSGTDNGPDRQSRALRTIRPLPLRPHNAARDDLIAAPASRLA